LKRSISFDVSIPMSPAKKSENDLPLDLTLMLDVLLVELLTDLLELTLDDDWTTLLDELDAEKLELLVLLAPV